mmetsp:Transcript_9304/g.16783  ORF Transcript_9304/g.16783 Transcript_9304/m.16783 type:complete len:292 (+) Transcript_9304:60-935(+)
MRAPGSLPWVLAICAWWPCSYSLRPLEDYQHGEAHAAEVDIGETSQFEAELLEANAVNTSLSSGFNPEECLFLIKFMHSRITGPKPRARKTENAEWMSFYHKKTDRVSREGDLLGRKIWQWSTKLDEAVTMLKSIAQQLNVVNAPKRYRFKTVQMIEADTTHVVNKVLKQYFDTRHDEGGLLVRKLKEIKEGAVAWNNRCYAKKSTGKMFDDWYRQQGKEPPRGLVMQSPQQLTRGFLDLLSGFNRANWDEILEKCVHESRRDFEPITFLDHVLVVEEPLGPSIEDLEFKV